MVYLRILYFLSLVLSWFLCLFSFVIVCFYEKNPNKNILKNDPGQLHCVRLINIVIKRSFLLQSGLLHLGSVQVTGLRPLFDKGSLKNS